MIETFVLIIWPMAGAFLYLIGWRLSTRKLLDSPKFFALSCFLFFFFLFLLFIITLPPPLPEPLAIEVLSVNGREGFIMVVDANDFEKIDIPPFNVTIRVIGRYNEKPVPDAKVIVSGAGTKAVGKTGKDGIVILNVRNAILEENRERDYMSIEVIAQGYYKYVEEEGIMLVRV